MFLEERIVFLERQTRSLGEEMSRLREELARLSSIMPNLSIEVPSDRPTLSTKEAAYLLNRAPQTLRVWATYENGPIRPRRVNRRLLWATEDVMQLIKHGDQKPFLPL